MPKSQNSVPNAVQQSKLLPTLPFFCIVFFVGGCMLSQYSKKTDTRSESPILTNDEYVRMSVENIELRLLLKACRENTVLDSATLQFFNHHKFNF